MERAKRTDGNYRGSNRMKSEQILMKSIQIIFTSFLNQIGLWWIKLFVISIKKTSTIFWVKLYQFLRQINMKKKQIRDWKLVCFSHKLWGFWVKLAANSFNWDSNSWASLNISAFMELYLVSYPYFKTSSINVESAPSHIAVYQQFSVNVWAADLVDITIIFGGFTSTGSDVKSHFVCKLIGFLKILSKESFDRLDEHSLSLRLRCFPLAGRARRHWSMVLRNQL